MTACLLYDKIHKNQAENLLHLMLYFSRVKGLSEKILTKAALRDILLQDKSVPELCPAR